MTRSQRLGVLLVVAGLCVVLGVGGAAVVGATDHLDDNGTQHEHPDEVGDRGDLAAVQDWLAGRMTEIHLDCAANLSTTEQTACDRLDEEYPEYLEQYASVERDRTGNNRTAGTFEETRENQAELAEETESFWEAYEAYQDARAAGDEDRRRRLARELTERSERIETLGGSLAVRFARLEERTGNEYGPDRRTTNDTTMMVLRTTGEVQATEFTPSRLTATITDGTATFREPAVVEGRLTAENGTALADRTVRVTVDDRTVATVETDDEGRYAATYRPVRTTTGPTTVRAWYEPTGTDPYLGSNGSDDVDVEPVSASTFADVDDDRVAFGDTMPVRARVAVRGVEAAGVPVRVFLDGDRIASGRTGVDGEVLLAGAVPATVPDGEAILTVRASRDGRALEPSERSVPVTVEESETDLTVEGLLDGEALVLSGRLTANGRPVPDQRVGVNVDGETRELAVTDDEGRYRVRVPRGTGGRGVWSVTADFRNPTTNLGPTTTTRQLRADALAATDGTDASTTLVGELRQLVAGNAFLRTLSDAELLAFAIGVLALAGLAVAGTAWVVRRRRDDEPGADRDGVTGTIVDVPDGVDDPDPSGDGVPTDPDPDPSPSVLGGAAALDVARARLGDGDPDDAVRIGYGTVRLTLSARAGGDEPPGGAAGDGDPRTHWEFYRDAEAKLSDDRAEALERLTLAYQRAEFAPDGTTRGSARAALDAAEACLSPAPDGRPTDVA